MIFLPRNASDDQVLALARHWVGVLASEDYETVFKELGYALLYQHKCPGPQAIRNTINNYRSPTLYPGIEAFKVTDWRMARGDNPDPLQKITWFKPNSIGVRGTLSYHLPLNNRWSDLEADFVWFESRDTTQGLSFSLEEIGSPTQLQRELENAP